MEVYQYPEDYQCSVIGNQDWQDAMIITNDREKRLAQFRLEIPIRVRNLFATAV